MNTCLRAAAKNDIEKAFHNLMNNPVYGMTCENQRKGTDVQLIKDRQKTAKLVTKPHSLDVSVFHKNL